MQTSDQINLVIAVATCLSVLGSLAVAYLTLHITKANRLTAELMKEQLEASTRPYIQISPAVRIGSQLIELRIANTGQSNAEDLKLDLAQDYYFNAEPSEAKNIRKYTAFVHPISSFSPRAELVFDLGVGPKIFTNSERCPQRFTITATYKHGSKQYSESTAVDLQPLQLTSVPHDPVADHLEELVKAVKQISSELRSHRD
ncbi:hypothetical protein [Roseateles sp. PN1]|uniref:hypothetical protein n=1 Tax=Roseateles sp. PN1 TaxID=3137372 RepID=UPI003138A67D